MTEAGFMGLTVPHAWGGPGGSYFDAVLVIEEFAKACSVCGRIAVEANMGAIGAIMAIGVAVANAILLVTFAEAARQRGANPLDSAIAGATSRLRPILMTSAAMIAGMIPMALGLGEGGAQTAPLGRAVAGGLLVVTIATLFVLPAVFTLLAPSRFRSASIDPEDPQSPHFQKGVSP